MLDCKDLAGFRKNCARTWFKRAKGQERTINDNINVNSHFNNSRNKNCSSSHRPSNLKLHIAAK